MMRAFWKLTWLELKIFAREPLGLIGTLVVPALVVVLIGRGIGAGPRASEGVRNFVAVDLPVLAALFAALNAVLSLVTIIAIYREGGILKRLRATPLTPAAILSAHVVVKMITTLATLAVVMVAGRRVLAVPFDARLLSFTAAALVSMVSIISIGFLIASLTPTARFAQPLGAMVLYPMLAVSGLFVPLALMPAWMSAIAKVLPLTYAVSLLRGIWIGQPWSAHLVDVAALGIFAAVFTVVSSRYFRWQ